MYIDKGLQKEREVEFTVVHSGVIQINEIKKGTTRRTAEQATEVVLCHVWLMDRMGARRTTMEELLKKCEKCGGNGSGVSAKQSEWSASLPPQKANEALDMGGPCRACNGRGKVLTEEGKKIREVMKHVEQGGR